MITWMPAARAIWARRWTSAFDVLAGNHHQVGHFVDDARRYKGSGCKRELFRLVDSLAGLAVKTGLDGAR